MDYVPEHSGEIAVKKNEIVGIEEKVDGTSYMVGCFSIVVIRIDSLNPNLGLNCSWIFSS